MSDNIVKYHSKIVGVTFEGRQQAISRMGVRNNLRVRREPENEYDPKAVAVDALFLSDAQSGTQWVPIGYIAKDKNADIAAALDAGKEVEITLVGVTGGGDKSLGVNVELEYEKVKDDTKVVSEPKTSPAASHELSEGVLNELKLLEGIRSLLGVKKETRRYISRLLGKSTEVTVINGHVSLPGYLSGSAFPKKFYAEFDEKEMLQKIADKFDVDKERVKAMWNLNREASTGYGTAIHAALENYDKNYRLGDKIKSVKVLKTKTNIGPNKALSRNPFLKKIVQDFHEKFGGDYVRLNEQFIWWHEKELCGAIDRVKVIDAEKKVIRIQDFKTDGDIHEKTYQLKESPFYSLTQGDTPKMGKELLDLHWLQLSFYAYILEEKYGYTVEGLDVYWLNPEKLCKGENAWEEFSHDVIDIEKGL